MSPVDLDRTWTSASACSRTSRTPSATACSSRLEKGPATASELAAALGVSPTQLANHLRRLRDRGLVAVRRRGRHAAYELAEPGLRELFSVLNELRATGLATPRPARRRGRHVLRPPLGPARRRAVRRAQRAGRARARRPRRAAGGGRGGGPGPLRRRRARRRGGGSWPTRASTRPRAARTWAARSAPSWPSVLVGRGWVEPQPGARTAASRRRGSGRCAACWVPARRCDGERPLRELGDPHAVEAEQGAAHPVVERPVQWPAWRRRRASPRRPTRGGAGAVGVPAALHGEADRAR